MKIVQSSIVRAVAAIAVGILLVIYREDMMRWITITAGILFFISGLISCIVYYLERRKVMDAPSVTGMGGKTIVRNTPVFPVVGAGSIILGIILAVMPTDFIIGVTYILATMLILGAVSQLVNLFRARRYSYIPVVFWLFPLITFAIGMLILCKPMAAATLPLKIIGWCMMFYGVIECVNALKIHSVKKKAAAAEKTAAYLPEDILDTGNDKTDDSRPE